MLKRLNQEIKQRTHIVRIFPNEASFLRLVRALAVETHEEWLEATCYLNMNELKEHKKHLKNGIVRKEGSKRSMIPPVGGSGANKKPLSELPCLRRFEKIPDFSICRTCQTQSPKDKQASFSLAVFGA